MSKVTVSIGAKDFDITLDEEFSQFFEANFKETFGEKTNIETKELLYAFVQKSYDEYLNKIEYKKLIDKIEEV
jgi:hypothetical protein